MSEQVVLTQEKKVRDSNIELFRIITMLLIIAHHYVVNSDVLRLANLDPLSYKSIFLYLFGAWGKIGINCFVLITGYFMCKSHITAKKFVKLLFEVMFYRIMIYIIFWVVGYEAFSIKGLVKAILPVTSVKQNFTGTYLIFFLCIPFLNILISNLNEKQHIRLLLISLFTYVFFGTFKFFPVSMNYVSWYIVLYFISSYVRLYPKDAFSSKKLWGWMMVLSVLLCAVSVVSATWLGGKLDKDLTYYFVTDSNTFLAVFCGFSSFMFFKNLHIKPSKFINAVSATTFGVFLIHSNSATMRTWLWKDLLDNCGAFVSKWMPLHAVGSVIGIFIVCATIDYVRIVCLERPFFKWWDRKFPTLAEKIARLEEKLCQKFHINN